jgi:hypothetical protein
MSRALRSCLRLLLALVLGLGPLGASVLAASLHAPFCGCSGCSPAAESCCEAASAEVDSGARLTAAEEGCACAVVQPEHGAPPAVAPRTCEARSHARGVLARGQRLVALEWSPAPVPLVRSDVDPGASGRHAAHGPPGVDAVRGGARAAAFGTLRL